MKEIIKDSLGDMRKVFNTYLTMAGTAFLLYAIKYLNNEYYSDPTPYTFLQVKIHPEYFSGLFGVLFLMFIIILTLRFNRLDCQLTAAIETSSPEEGHNLACQIRYSNWLLSPFRGIFGRICFTFIIVIGIYYSLRLSIAHSFGSPPNGSKFPEEWYERIGYLVFGVTLISTLSVIYIEYVISAINRKLNKVNT